MRGQPAFLLPDFAKFIIGRAKGATRWLHPGYACRTVMNRYARAASNSRAGGRSPFSSTT
jgi:hypothetical protein